MSPWEQVVASALVGTERRPPPSDVLGLPAQGSAEATLLSAAAALSTWRRAGFEPAHRAELPDPAPADTERPAPAAAAQILELLLHGDVRIPGGPAGLIASWLERAAASGYAIPRRLLPAVVERLTDPDLLDTRGRWLVAQFPDWLDRLTGAGDAEERFALGDKSERETAFRQLRARDPERARELLEAGWKQEKPNERAQFVAALAVGLSPDDEPFLEAALDDRAQKVRAAAVLVLDGLPTSARAQRMYERAGPLLRLTSKLMRKRIEAEFPDEPDQAARRDGVVDERAGIGLAAWWLQQYVRASPLWKWEEQFGLPPEEIVRLGVHQPELRTAWSYAATLQRNPVWAAALFKETTYFHLLAVMPSAAAQELAEPRLAKADDAGAASIIRAAGAPWSAPFSRAVVDRMRRLPTFHYDNIASLIAERLHPSAAPLVEAWSDGLRDDDRARRVIRAVHHAVTLRDSIAKELA